jgi:O-antigen/teichoic acid export membrane protein
VVPAGGIVTATSVAADPLAGSPEGAKAPVGLSLLRHSSIYLLGNLMQKATAFLLIPIYTRTLSTSQYGLLELANTLVNLLLVVAALGLPGAINKCLHRDCRDEADRRRLVGTTTLFTAGSALVLGALGWSLEGWLAPRLAPGADGLLVYRSMLVWLVLAQLTVIPFEILRAAGRPQRYVLLSFSQLVAQTSVTLYCVFVLGWTLAGVLAGNVAGFVAVTFLGGAVVFRSAEWTLDRRLLRAGLLYGMAMIPVFVSGWIVNLSDRFFVGSMAGLAALGVYALGYKFGALLDLLLVMPFQRAWTPMFFSLSKRPDAPRVLARVASALVLFLALATVGVSLAVPPFLRLSAGAEFQGAAVFVPLICIAYIFSGLANCLANGLVVAERVRLVAGYALLAAAVNLVLNALLIPGLAGIGAAVSTILAFAVQLAGVVRSLGRHFPVPMEWGRLAGIGAAALVPLAGGWLLPPLGLPLDLAARLALFASFPTILLASGLVRPDERRAAARVLGEAWGSWRRRA